MKTVSALKLAGLVTFVANSCPALSPDYTRFRTALGALGLTVEDLAKDKYKTVYMGYAARYGADTTANCERARLAFGARGSTIPDLLQKR